MSLDRMSSFSHGRPTGISSSSEVVNIILDSLPPIVPTIGSSLPFTPFDHGSHIWIMAAVVPRRRWRACERHRVGREDRRPTSRRSRPHSSRWCAAAGTLSATLLGGEKDGAIVFAYLARVHAHTRNRDGRGECEEEQARRSREGANRRAFIWVGYSLPNIAGVSSSVHSCHAVNREDQTPPLSSSL